MGVRTKLAFAFLALVLAVVAVSVLEVDRTMAVMVSDLGNSGELLVSQTFEQVREVLGRASGDPYQALRKDRRLTAFLQSSLAFSRGVVYVRIDSPAGIPITGAPPIAPEGALPAVQPFTELSRRTASPWPFERIAALWGNHTYEIDRPVEIDNRPFAIISVGLSTGLIAAEVQRALEGILAVGGAAVIVSLLAAMFLGAAVVGPVEAVTRGMESLTTGDGEVRLDIGGHDELRTLADKFNELSQQIRTDRTRWENERGQFFNIFRSITDAVLLLDRDGMVLFANAEAQGRLGLPAGGLADGKPLKLLLSKEHPLVRMTETVFVTGTEVHDVALALDDEPNSNRFLVSIFSLGRGPEPPGLLVILRDLVPVQELESVVDYSGRLARLGGLISGVAHQIRTPLNALNLQLELLSQDATNGRRLEPRIDLIRKQIHRLDQAIAALMRFMRPEELKLARLNVNDLLIEIGGQVVRPGIKVEYALDRGVGQIWADRALLGEALRNIVNNAVEAMPRGGVLTLGTSARGGESVELTLRDQGQGIPPEHLDRIFHLYYTTKKEGSGLGLSLALRAIDLHRGTLDVQSTVGSGTIVTVCLPGLEAETRRFSSEAGMGQSPVAREKL